VIGRVLGDYGPFGLVFVDPPYDDPTAAEVARTILEADWFAEPGWLIYQHSKDAPPEGLPEPTRVRAFGETVIAWHALSVKGA
jgi:16S rRNA G966 N2-methylase RsmD